MPQLGETVLEGVVSAWYKKPGDRIAADEALFEVETEKVSTEIPSPAAGVVREILVQTGVSVKVGTRLAVIETAGASPSFAPAGAGASEGKPSEAPPGAKEGRNGALKLSPVVRRLLGESGIRAEDVRAQMASAVAPPGAKAEADDTLIALNKVRRATGAHMVRSVATSPHVLQAVEVDFYRVEAARRAIGDAWRAREGFTLSYLPFVCAAACKAIAEFPMINASFGEDALIVHRRVHLGIAVDLAFDGLVAPVLRDANRRSLHGLALDLHELVARARANGLRPDELSGGTYTISNSGSFGTLITAPIINQPQVAILSTDGVRKKPVVIEGPDGDAVAIRPVGVLAQSFDHRAFDGAYSAAFLRRLKEELETRDWIAELG